MQAREVNANASEPKTPSVGERGVKRPASKAENANAGGRQTASESEWGTQ